MQKLDAVKLGILCITVICIIIGVAGLIWAPEDKKVEIALASLAGVSVIGGWLGHSMVSGKDLGSDVPEPKLAVKPPEPKSPVFGATK